jgi:hypothetical protein
VKDLFGNTLKVGDWVVVPSKTHYGKSVPLLAFGKITDLYEWDTTEKTQENLKDANRLLEIYKKKEAEEAARNIWSASYSKDIHYTSYDIKRMLKDLKENPVKYMARVQFDLENKPVLPRFDKNTETYCYNVATYKLYKIDDSQAMYLEMTKGVKDGQG